MTGLSSLRNMHSAKKAERNHGKAGSQCLCWQPALPSSCWWSEEGEVTPSLPFRARALTRGATASPASSFVVRVGLGPPAPSAGRLQSSSHLWDSKGEEGGDKEEGRPLAHLPVSRKVGEQGLHPLLLPAAQGPASSRESIRKKKRVFQSEGIPDKPLLTV